MISVRDVQLQNALYPSVSNEDGSVTKPFLLPQKDPHFYDSMTRSFNVPDLGHASVGFDAAEIGRVWREVPAEQFD